MARGIGENSLTKIFLTRSFLGPIFRPFLYSAEEYVHYTFLEEITMLTHDIMAIPNLEQRGLTYYWLIEAPRSLFEELFITGGGNQKQCNVLDDTASKDGSELAYLTQGYILAILAHMLEKEERLQLHFNVKLSDLEEIIIAALGLDNRIFHYQHYFQQLIHECLEDVMDDAIPLFYIKKVIAHLDESSSIPRENDLSVKIEQKALAYCLWKLQNIESTATAMVRRFSEVELRREAQLSSGERNY